MTRKKRIRIGIAAAIVAILIFFAIRIVGPMIPVFVQVPPRDFAKLSTDEWRQDIEYLARELPRRHINAFAQVDRSAFDAEVAALLTDLPSLDSQTIPVRIMQLVALIGDGHTQAVPFAPSTGLYPLNLEWFSDGLYVTRAGSSAAEALGGKVVGIGSLTVEDAYSALAVIVPHENDSRLKVASQQYLVIPQILSTLGIAETSEAAEYTFEDSTGRRFELELKPVVPSSGESWNNASPTLPLYRQQRDQNYWYRYLDESRTMYVKYNACMGMAGFSRWAESMWAAFDSRPAERLVIDLRGNGGGSSIIFRPILKGIASRTSLNQRGRLFVITDRYTFSSAVLNAVELRNQTEALFYGEPTGGKPNHYGEVRAFYLRHSRIRVFYSTKYFRDSPEDTPSLMPDVTVIPTADDYFAGRDPALEAILAAQPK